MGWFLIAFALAAAVIVIFGISKKIILSEYVIKTTKVEKSVSLAFLSDFHSQKSQNDYKEIFDLLKKAKPDCVLFGGDILDKYGCDEDFERSISFLKKIVEKYPSCYFVTGNHEFQSDWSEAFLAKVSSLGIKICNGKGYVFTAANNQKIFIGGVDNVLLGEKEVQKQKERLSLLCKGSNLFSVLLRHVPMNGDDENFDLVLSGHNHGGLWRLPKTKIGAAGGGKKLFPKYTHGIYKTESTTMIVNSGIIGQTYFLPRLYNPPEIVSIKIAPKL